MSKVLEIWILLVHSISRSFRDEWDRYFVYLHVTRRYTMIIFDKTHAYVGLARDRKQESDLVLEAQFSENGRNPTNTNKHPTQCRRIETVRGGDTIDPVPHTWQTRQEHTA